MLRLLMIDGVIFVLVMAVGLAMSWGDITFDLIVHRLLVGALIAPGLFNLGVGLTNTPENIDSGFRGWLFKK